MTRTAPILATTVLLALAGCGSEAATPSAEQTAPAADLSGGLAETAAPGAEAAATPAGSQTLDIVDQAGMGRPMTLGRITVPAGWRPEGGVAWDRSTPCVTNQQQIKWSAVAPDGLTAISLLPGYGWQSPQGAIQMNPCPVLPVASARDFLQMAAQAMRPGSRVLGYQPRPNMPQATADGNGRNDAGTLRIAYQVNGRAVEEELTAYVGFNPRGGSTQLVFGYRAPAGRLDPAQAEAVRTSFRFDPNYQVAYRDQGIAAADAFGRQQSNQIATWHAGRMADITARGMADRAAIRARGNAETAAIYAQTAADTSATNDRMYGANLRALREEQTWSNPATGQTVQGSIHGGERVLQMGDGSFARTDDPYYNPAGSTEYSPD